MSSQDASWVQRLTSVPVLLIDVVFPSASKLTFTRSIRARVQGRGSRPSAATPHSSARMGYVVLDRVKIVLDEARQPVHGDRVL
jgi:hypothetical protein